MLQQTKVDTVIHYYDKFIERYPTIYDLAAASEQDVLIQWEGLGYYSRARHLHAAVKEVVANYGGQVPNDVTTLGKLKGIGPYTRGAIASIAFNQPEPAVDGNVMRVLARIFLIEENILADKTRRRFEQIVRELICKEDPASFNQALMELGALICIPRSPRCHLCPVQSFCRAYEQGKEKVLPIRAKTTNNKVKHYIAICLINEREEVAIEQRASTGLLANTWQFPMLDKDTIKGSTAVNVFKQRYGIDVKIVEKLGQLEHQFSHLTWHITAYKALPLKKEQLPVKKLLFVNDETMKLYPFSVAQQKINEFLTKY